MPRTVTLPPVSGVGDDICVELPGSTDSGRLAVVLDVTDQFLRRAMLR